MMMFTYMIMIDLCLQTDVTLKESGNSRTSDVIIIIYKADYYNCL